MERTERADYPGHERPGADGVRRPRRGRAPLLRAALLALGAPAVERRRTSTSRRTASTGTSASPPRSASSACTACRSFFIGEQRVAAELGPMMRAAARTRTCASSSAPRSPTRRVTCSSSTASTRRSACSRPTTSRIAWRRRAPTSTRTSACCSTRCWPGRVDRLAREPEDLETLVEAVTLYHMVIEGMLALTGQHFIIEYNESIGHAARLRRGVQQRGARRASPRGLRRALPARHGRARRALPRGDPAHAGGVRPGGRRRAQAAVVRRERGRRASSATRWTRRAPSR